MHQKKTDGGHVFAGEFVGCVRDQQAGLANGTVTNDHAFDGLHAAVGRVSE